MVTILYYSWPLLFLSFYSLTFYNFLFSNSAISILSLTFYPLSLTLANLIFSYQSLCSTLWSSLLSMILSSFSQTSNDLAQIPLWRPSIQHPIFFSSFLTILWVQGTARPYHWRFYPPMARSLYSFFFLSLFYDNTQGSLKQSLSCIFF